MFKSLAGTQTPVTVIPVGTANNVADTLGLRSDEPAQLVRAWDKFVLRGFDVGEIAAESGTRQFVEGIGGGLFAEMLARAEQTGADDASDKVALGLRLLRGVLSAAPASRWEIQLDGRDCSRDLVGVEALNIREVGPNCASLPTPTRATGCSTSC